MRFLNKIFNFLIAAGFVCYGLYFYFNKSHLNQDQVQKTDFSSVDHEKIVNKYLQQTSQQILKDQAASKRVLDQAMKEPLKPSKEPAPAEIPRDRQIHKDTSVVGVGREIQKPNLEKIDKKEYARQFIENARKGGYHIELSEDLEVISVTPLREPSQEIDSFEILPSN